MRRILGITALILGLAACQVPTPQETFAQKLTAAHHTVNGGPVTAANIEADIEEETKKDSKGKPVKDSKGKEVKIKVLKAYDFNALIDTDDKPATTCKVELEHPANARGLIGTNWIIDEVNNQDVDGPTNSPDLEAVKKYLREKDYSC